MAISQRASSKVRPKYLAFLAPDIQQAIMEGRQPAGLCLEDLRRTPIPLCWDDQRRLLES